MLRNLKLKIFLPAIMLASCTTAADRLGDRPTVQELDKWNIDSMTKTRIRTGAQGYDGISGRIMTLLLTVSKEMEERYSDRCGEDPVLSHIFLYKEEGDTLRVQTAPRFVPDDTPPPPPPPEGYRYIYMHEIADVPKNSVALEGCDIQFVVDSKTKSIVSTNIMR